MNQDENEAFKNNLYRKIVETQTYAPDPISGVVKVVTLTTFEKTGAPHDDESDQAKTSLHLGMLQNYLNEHHDLLIKNSVAQEKLIMQISILLIGSTLTFSKLLETTDLNFFTLLGVYLFIATIISSISSYSLAQFVIRVSMEKAEAYYNDRTEKVPLPDITKHWAERLRKSLDYLTALIFCAALPITFFGISKQYKEFRTNQTKEINMSNSTDSTRSLGPKVIPKKPDTTPSTNTNTSSNQGKNNDE